MTMFRIVGVWTGGRLAIEPQAGKIELFHSNSAGVVAHYRVPADQTEERLSLSSSRRISPGCALQNFNLLTGRELGEARAMVLLRGGVQPAQSISHGLLDFLFAVGGHEIDELAHARLLRARGLILGNDQPGENVDGSIFDR